MLCGNSKILEPSRISPSGCHMTLSFAAASVRGIISNTISCSCGIPRLPHYTAPSAGLRFVVSSRPFVRGMEVMSLTLKKQKNPPFFRMAGLNPGLWLFLLFLASHVWRTEADCHVQWFWKGQSGDNKSLIESLRQGRIIKSQRVTDVMEQIDRGLFVPEGNPAYMDSPVPIGYNATISAPHMHALCLELLKDNLQPGMNALDVGSGTGYLTACFGLMVGPEGYAVGVEHIPELVEQSINNVKKSRAANLLSSGHLSLHVRDGRKGWPERAPYDVIHVGAAASEIPKALIEQLKPGGRMVIPVGDFFQDLRVIDKNSDGTLTQWSETSVRYVPLTSKDQQLQAY